MSSSTAPHAYEASKQPNVCERCGCNRTHAVHMADRPNHEVCINCLMTQGKARKLEYRDGAYECETVGGCRGRFTTGYLNKVTNQVKRLMDAFKIDTSQLIVKGSKTEKIEAAAMQQLGGERQVILPDDD